MARRAAAALVVAVALVALPACERQVSGPSLVLRLASPEPATQDTGPPIEWFAAEVDRRSGGTIRIEPVWDVAVAGTTGFDQFTAGKVVDGTYELGLVPSRAWDELGVESLRALNAPFLLTSHAALASVLSGSLRAQLMAGLSDAGVVGLDLFPDALRHPFGFDEPLLGVGGLCGHRDLGPRLGHRHETVPRTRCRGHGQRDVHPAGRRGGPVLAGACRRDLRHRQRHLLPQDQRPRRRRRPAGTTARRPVVGAHGRRRSDPRVADHPTALRLRGRCGVLRPRRQDRRGK